jgi:glycosyltransferase involved in cell wall biosynthesis
MGSKIISIQTARLNDLSAKEIYGQITNRKKKEIVYPPYPIFALSRFYLSILWFFKIIFLSRRFRFSLIHAQDTGYAGLAAVISGRILGIPVIITSHGMRHEQLNAIVRGRNKKLILKFEHALDIFTIKSADSVIAVNSSIKNYYEQKTSRRINFFPVAIKLAKFQFSEVNRDSIRRELGIHQKTIIIGFIGRFSPEKNLITLLISFARAANSNRMIRLVLVGEGRSEHHLRRFVIENGVKDKVIFCGVRYDIDKILAALDIFVLPSYTEGFSFALMEAMSCGRAIICSDIPANRELVKHYQEALLVNPHDEHEFVHAIEVLSNDEPLRKRLGENAKIRVCDYDEEVVYPKILEHYEDLIGKE